MEENKKAKIQKWNREKISEEKNTQLNNKIEMGNGDNGSFYYATECITLASWRSFNNIDGRMDEAAASAAAASVASVVGDESGSSWDGMCMSDNWKPILTSFCLSIRLWRDGSTRQMSLCSLKNSFAERNSPSNLSTASRSVHKLVLIN